MLATLHTNDATSAVTRLIDMGWSPSCCRRPAGVLAQRLVRKSAAAATAKAARPAATQATQGAPGFELLVTDDAIRAQIHAQASEAEIRTQPWLLA